MGGALILCGGYDGPTGLGTPDGVAAFASGPQATVSGTVTDAATGNPLTGAEKPTATRNCPHCQQPVTIVALLATPEAAQPTMLYHRTDIVRIRRSQ